MLEGPCCCCSGWASGGCMTKSSFATELDMSLKPSGMPAVRHGRRLPMFHLPLPWPAQIRGWQEDRALQRLPFCGCMIEWLGSTVLGAIMQAWLQTIFHRLSYPAHFLGPAGGIHLRCHAAAALVLPSDAVHSLLVWFRTQSFAYYCCVLCS
jgi:hypothetical protein